MNFEKNISERTLDRKEYKEEDVVKASSVEDIENLGERMEIARKICDKKENELKNILENNEEYFHHTILFYPRDDFIKKSIAISQIPEKGIMTEKTMEELGLKSERHGGWQNIDKISLFNNKDEAYFESGGPWAVCSFIIKPSEKIAPTKERYEDEFEHTGDISSDEILGVVINGFYKGKIEYLNKVANNGGKEFTSKEFIENRKKSVEFASKNSNKYLDEEGTDARLSAVYSMLGLLTTSMMNNPENSFPVYFDDSVERHPHKPAWIISDDLKENVKNGRLFPVLE